MGPHPEPPHRLRLLVRPFNGPWFRSFDHRYDPVYFGRRAANRFDAPAGEFGTCYLARDCHGAFIETFGHETGVRAVTERELAARSVARIVLAKPATPLRLVDLRGEGLARMGADNALATGHDLALARRWAKALHDHPRRPDGIAYRARHDPARTSVALFERAASKIRVQAVTPWLRPTPHPQLADILNHYDFGLISP